MKPHKALWISLSAILGTLAIGLTVATPIAFKFETIINGKLGLKNYEIVDNDTNTSVDTSYYKSAFGSESELTSHEKTLCESLEGEGAVLLKNNNATLPLKTSTKFSCFSHSSVDLIYGGTGSGQVATADAISLKSALEKNFGAGSVNPSLWNFYLNDCTAYKRTNAKATGGSTEDYLVNEVPWANLSGNSGLTSTFESYGDVALAVIARSGGEGSDLPYKTCKDGVNGDYLHLTQNEMDMLHALKTYKDQGVFKKIVVLLNYSNDLQVDFLNDANYGVDAALWIGDVGMTGINAVSDILLGSVNPSGRLVDTFLNNTHSSPAMVNFGFFSYANATDYALDWIQSNTLGKGDKCNKNYLVYQEGIYVGYRYYETRYEDYVMGTDNSGSYSYASDVAYPFGYGASYTSFAYTDFKLAENGDVFTTLTTVKNTGNVAGKHSVAIYAQSPYTSYDKENGVEKSAVILAGFGKTKSLAPGESETVSVSIPKRVLASYDSNKAKTYILDAGKYYFTPGENAHDATNNILAEKGYSPAATSSKMDAAGNASLVKNWNENNLDAKSCSKSEETGYAITNQFDDADLNKYEGTSSQKVTYLTRSDWNGSFPKNAPSLSVTPTMWNDGLINTVEGKAAIASKMEKTYHSDAKSVPTMGAQNGLQAITFRGVKADSEAWNPLLQQASFDEMTNVIYNGFHCTKELPSIGLPATKDENGPQGYTKSLMGGSSAMAYTSEDIMAATFNRDLLADMGACIGEDCLNVGCAGLYGPACNIHRTPYCGRNFEYYSEDGFLASEICEPEVKAIQSKGVYVFTKHFALNDQENGRMGVSTWANEQTIREIYLKGFEGSVKGGGAGVMTSFNRLGVVWSGSHYGLMTEILRNEWGMQGAAITDCSVFATYMDVRMGIAAGQDLWDGYGISMNGVSTKTLDGLNDNPAVVQGMQRAVKRITYSIANSLAMNGISSTSHVVSLTPWWKNFLVGMDVTLWVLALAAGTRLTIGILQAKKAKKQTVTAA